MKNRLKIILLYGFFLTFFMPCDSTQSAINIELANSEDIIEKTFDYIEKTIHPLF